MMFRFVLLMYDFLFIISPCLGLLACFCFRLGLPTGTALKWDSGVGGKVSKHDSHYVISSS